MRRERDGGGEGRGREREGLGKGRGTKGDTYEARLIRKLASFSAALKAKLQKMENV